MVSHWSINPFTSQARTRVLYRKSRKTIIGSYIIEKFKDIYDRNGRNRYL